MSKDDTEEPEVEDNLEDLKLFITSFLDIYPNPSEDQVHQLASILGIPYEALERLVFSMFSELVEETDIEDPLDLLLLSFFVLNPSPEEDEIHSLARLCGITPDVLEERIYSLMADSEALETPEVPQI